MKKRRSAKRNAVSDQTRHYRWCLFVLLPLLYSNVGVFLFGCSRVSSRTGDPMRSTPSELTFQPYEIVTGTAAAQTILTGFLLGGTHAELVVVNIDENGDRDMDIHVFSDGTWLPKFRVRLRPEVLFVDVIHINGRDRLIMYEAGQLNWFDLNTDTEHVLVTVPSLVPPPHDTIPHVDITHDVSGDGHDDLVIPDADGFWVFVQKSDGTFADPVKLGPSTEVNRLYDPDEYRYAPWKKSRIHELDYNQDRRKDLVFWNVDHFAIHFQGADGLFAAESESFTTEVRFDSDDVAWLAAPHGVRRRRRDHQPGGNLTGRVLHAFTDMNGDGIADLGVFELKGGSLWRMHFTYEVHFGAWTPEGVTTFAPEVSTRVQGEGIPFTMEPHDFNQDGYVDMMFATINPSLFKAIGMIIGSVLIGSVPIDLEFYAMEGGRYPDMPSTTRTFRSYPKHETGGRTRFSSVLSGDVNGDGRADLLMQHGTKEIRVFRGVPGPHLFARKPQKVAVTTPTREDHTWLTDVNKDNKRDVLMFHASRNEPHRVTILISQ